MAISIINREIESSGSSPEVNSKPDGNQEDPLATYIRLRRSLRSLEGRLAAVRLLLKTKSELQKREKSELDLEVAIITGMKAKVLEIDSLHPSLNLGEYLVWQKHNGPIPEVETYLAGLRNDDPAGYTYLTEFIVDSTETDGKAAGITRRDIIERNLRSGASLPLGHEIMKSALNQPPLNFSTDHSD